MSDVVFVDTNFLIYAHEFDASLIVASAAQARASQLYTEDLNAGQSIVGVKVVNPLVAS